MWPKAGAIWRSPGGGGFIWRAEPTSFFFFRPTLFRRPEIRESDMTWLDAPGPVTVLGLQYGDEGKGTVVECLVRRAVLRGVEPSKVLVVRFNGGPQAAHHVVLDDGTHHVFSQFGSGSLSGARTLIARRALIAPDRIAREAMALARQRCRRWRRRKCRRWLRRRCRRWCRRRCRRCRR